MDRSRTSHRPPRAPDLYEEYQGWPAEVADGVARYVNFGRPGSCLVLGCATGVNDALPLARVAGRGCRIVAGDLEPAYLERLQERVISEGLSTVEARRIDLTGDLSGLGAFDAVSLLFVIHRIAAWEEALDRVCRLVAPGGSFYISEFVGPEGIIYRSNEGGGAGTDPVARMIRRYFELVPVPFAPALKSTSIAPALERLAGSLRPDGHRDVGWPQTLMPAEMFRRIRDRAYAPFFGTTPVPGTLDRLRDEFSGEWCTAVRQTEVIRLYRFTRPG
jgi:SAM-dependent methyltransferase